MHMRKAIAFAMGVHARLGSESAVRCLKLDCINMVLLSYFSLPADFLDGPRRASDYAGIVDFMATFKDESGSPCGCDFDLDPVAC